MKYNSSWCSGVLLQLRFRAPPASAAKCPECYQSVYVAEMIHCFGAPYHSKCFRCKECKQHLRFAPYRLVVWAISASFKLRIGFFSYPLTFDWFFIRNNNVCEQVFWHAFEVLLWLQQFDFFEKNSIYLFFQYLYSIIKTKNEKCYGTLELVKTAVKRV